MNIDLNVDLGYSLDDLEMEFSRDVVHECSAVELTISKGSNDACTDSERDDVKSPPYEANGSGMNKVTEASEIAARLAPGNKLESLDQAYILYCEYARLMGFSVRKGTQKYFRKTDDIKMKLYHCSCEGHIESKESVFKLADYRKQDTRTGCKASLRLVRGLDGSWKVSVFNENHNHQLLGPDDSYLLRSSRKLSHAKKSILETFNDAGIGVSRACRFLENESRGPQNVGFIRKDAYDHIGKIRRVSRLDNNDAAALLRYFQEKIASEPYFFWKVLLDDDGRLMNFYFWDCRCADDFEAFGDVVSVDTTFKTNKYNLLCAPFVGINHHRQNILFGMAFLSDETTESFEWLFTTFLESMNGKEPEVIFSDQDQAMMNGIDYTFRSTIHRLCQWHINQNTPAHFGKLNGVKEFREMWFHCMNGCEDEVEFEDCWQKMIDTYGLHQHRWLTSMYDLRSRWSDVFSNKQFRAGLHATSRSEATNKVIKDLCAASSSLSEFVSHYETIISDWRLREREEDALNRGLPGQFIDGNRLLIQAAGVYTRNVYKIFKREAANSINGYVVQSFADQVGGDMEFLVTYDDSTKARKVAFNQASNNVSCSCRMLETDGIFCRHILKMFYIVNVTSLPENYILKRWTKEAKDRDRTSWSTHLSKRDTVSDIVFVNSIMRRTYDLAMDNKEVPECRQIMIDHIEALVAALAQKNGGKKKNGKGVDARSKTPTKVRFQNPRTPTHRWLPPKRRVSSFNKKVKKNSKPKAAAQAKEDTSLTRTASYARPPAYAPAYGVTENAINYTPQYTANTWEEFDTQLSMA